MFKGLYNKNEKEFQAEEFNSNVHMQHAENYYTKT